MNFNFGEVLTRAWQIIWKHKVLWIFGILASCGQSRGSGNSGSSGENGFNTSGTNLPPQVLEAFNWIDANAMQFVAIICAVICVIWLIVMFLSTIGRIGLIRGTAQAEGGADHLIFGQLFSESMPYFWRMFLLQLILSVPILLVVIGLVVFLVLGVGVASTGGEDAAALSVLGIVPIMLGCFCLLVPIMFVLGMIFRQAERAIVLEELETMPAISRGWEVFRANLGTLILMAIILGVLGFVLGLVIAIPLIIIVVPAMLAWAVGGAESNTPLILMGICICLFVPVAFLVQGIITAYAEAAWTLTFMRLTGKNPTQPQDTPPAQDPNQTLLAPSANG